jgi:DNA-binding transcriptional MerR regulator
VGGLNGYRTSQIANLVGVHPNTVRLYEKLGLIPKPERKPNGYRVFTDFHLEQVKLVRIALKVEVLQNNLRKKAIQIIKASASGDFDKAIGIAKSYREQVMAEQKSAKEAMDIVEQLLSGSEAESQNICLTRKETSERLKISMDALRNWEMNGLLAIKRKLNGYRVYTDEDLRRLKIIRCLRIANYSLSSILRMLNEISSNPSADIREVIDTPTDNDDIISVCDKLMTSLEQAEKNSNYILAQLEKMQKRFHTNPLL